MKKIQNFYLYSYRLVGFIFLSGLIFSILWYGFSLLFFITNSNWSIPMILSPNQEKVMAHLEHILVFEQEISKSKAELLSTERLLQDKEKMLAINKQLWKRLNESMSHQSVLYIKASATLASLSQEKSNQVSQLKALANRIKKDQNTINRELQLGLITKQEALTAQLKWSNLRANLIDAQTNKYDLKKRANDYAEAAQTLKGKGSHLNSMNKIIKKVELENLIAQLKSDKYALEIKIENLKNTISRKKRNLSLMKNSPYILATRRATPVAFIPYSHLNKVRIGSPVFSCYLDMILCYQSGRVLTIYNAEEYTKHPILRSDMKGQLIGVAFNHTEDAQKKLLFINSKPLFL